ncbi:MAG TPA: CoA transferase [Frankiaceae bacterium]|jgi:crotonobetainyl-CoA:carnitine CoA-transferase CaiB-like acyl-CoA transferase|nr:CoA transferase [Frankiaceae bacterium]
MASVLEGVRVLDLSSGVAGPIAGMLLADHGADVVKVEPPGGDPRRGNPGYDVWLRGRRSAVLDLRAAADHETFLALADSADVLIESFAPGTTARLGIDFETLSARNPALVHCSITAYGPHEGHRDRPGYDALVAARLGILHEQRGHLGGALPRMHGEPPYLEDLEIPDGMPPGSPRNGPIFTYTPWLSMATAFMATTSISAALYARLLTGRGQHVETSLLQAAFSSTASKWQRMEHPDATGLRSWVYDQRATKGMFRCSDGRWVQQWVPNPAFVLASADGDTLEFRGDVARVRDDPARIPQDPENIAVLAYYHPLMAEAFARFPSDQWVDVARQAGVPLQPVRTPEEALFDPALEAEGAVIDLEHPEHGPLRQAGILYGLSRTPGRVQRPVPAVGAHTAEIRAEAPRVLSVPAVADPPAMVGPLAGITVLDLGFAVAGPFGAQVLADLGADVIKVNTWRDPWWHASHIAYGANRNKRSIGIDLKTPEGLEVFHTLLAKADVVHSNMRRDAMRRLKCDEESLRAVNPDVIYCHTRGFDRGPRSDSPGNDQTGCSLAGVTHEDGGCNEGGVPFWSLTSLGDTGNGFFSAIGVIQALYHRRRTGEAQTVDTSILNAGMLVASMTAVKSDGTSLPKPRLDAMQLGLSPYYRLYETSDGWVCLAAIADAHRQALGAIARAAELESWFAARTAREAFEILDAAGIPVEIADDDFPLHVFDDPEMWAKGLVVRHQHPKLGWFENFGTTMNFSATPSRVWAPPPICGQHTREIMREYGYDDADIDKLIDARGIFEDLWVD